MRPMIAISLRHMKTMAFKQFFGVYLARFRIRLASWCALNGIRPAVACHPG